LAYNKKVKRPKKPLTPGGLFCKVFFIAFSICLVLFTGSVYGAFKFLDSSPASKSGVVAEQKTEEQLDLLIPGEGIFKSKYYNSKRVNVLLYGTTNEKLADTIMLCSFDPETEKVDVISVPRDTYYEREGFKYGGYLKINAAALEGPMELCKAVHNVLLGIPINYYAMVDYDGVKKIVDSMDGVPMDVPMDMKYTSKKQDLVINIKKGEQVLDGDHAVQFLRFRKGSPGFPGYADGDMGRVDSQQQFVKNAVKRALGLSLPKVAMTAVENVDTTITPRAVLYLADKAAGMSSDAVQAVTLPGEAKKNGLWFWIRADNSKIEEMLRKIYEGNADAAGSGGADPAATDTGAGNSASN
jgi:LCP family protein required for cell wall assembly